MAVGSFAVHCNAFGARPMSASSIGVTSCELDCQDIIEFTNLDIRNEFVDGAVGKPSSVVLRFHSKLSCRDLWRTNKPPFRDIASANIRTLVHLVASCSHCILARLTSIYK